MALDPAVLSEFKILIDAQTDKLQRTLRQQKAHMYREGRDMAKIFNSSFSSVFGVGLSTAGVTMLVTSALRTADALFKQSKQINVTVEDLQRLNFAAQQSGIEQANFARGLELLNDRAFDASNGMAEQKRAFDQLGVSIRTANGEMKDTTTLLREVLESLSKMSDSSARIGLARDIFGRSGAAFLNLGSNENLQALMDERSAMGLITTEEAERAEKFNDRLSAMKTRLMAKLENLTMNTLKEIEAIEDIAQHTRTSVKDIAGQAADVLTPAWETLKRANRGLEQVFTALGGDDTYTRNRRRERDAAVRNAGNAAGIPEGATLAAAAAAGPLGDPEGTVYPARVTQTGAPDVFLGGLEGAPPRMEMLDLSGAINRLDSSVNHLADLWEGFTLPESVTGRFNPVPVSIDAVTIGANGPQAARASVGGRAVNVNFFGSNVASPVEAIRAFSARSVLSPRGM